MKTPFVLLSMALAVFLTACHPETTSTSASITPADWTIAREPDSLVRDSLLPFTAILEGENENTPWQFRTPEQKNAFERIMGLCRRHQL